MRSGGRVTGRAGRVKGSSGKRGRGQGFAMVRYVDTGGDEHCVGLAEAAAVPLRERPERSHPRRRRGGGAEPRDSYNVHTDNRKRIRPVIEAGESAAVPRGATPVPPAVRAPRPYRKDRDLIRPSGADGFL